MVIIHYSIDYFKNWSRISLNQKYFNTMKVLALLPNGTTEDRKKSLQSVKTKFCPENSLYPLYGEQSLKNIAFTAKDKRVTGILFESKPVVIKETIAYLKKTFPHKQFHYFTLSPLSVHVENVHYFENCSELKAEMLKLSKQSESIVA